MIDLQTRHLPFEFLPDGHARARAAIETQVRAEIAAEYASQFEGAGIWRRLWLAIQSLRAVNRRIDQLAPRDGHY